MKVALVQTPVWWTVDPPLGLAQLAGCLKTAGHRVEINDLNIFLWANRSSEFSDSWLWEKSHLWNQERFVDRFFAQNSSLIEGQIETLLQSDARLIGFAIHGGSYLFSVKLAKQVKEADPSRLIVFGGQYFFRGTKKTEVFEDAPWVDAIINGAAEETFLSAVADVERSGCFHSRPGLSFRTGSSVVDGGPAMPLRDLDRLPYADFTGFPMDLYTDKTRIPIAASRGCIWACRFCSTRTFWDGYSCMSGERIFAEVRHQKQIFPHRAHFEFYDITANGRPENLRTFSQLAKEFIVSNVAEKNFRWKINAVFRPEMTFDLLRLMYEGGCQDIIYGVESGSPNVLKRMNKHYDISVAERVLSDTHKAGIRTTGNFMFGFPGETEMDFEMTLDFLRRNRPSLDRAYGSATLTSLEEFSYLQEHPSEFGIRPEPRASAHHLYWETEDKTNTYPVRLDRYTRFRQACAKLGIDAYKGIDGVLEQERKSNLATYHEYRDNRIEAIMSCVNYLETSPESGPVRERLKTYCREVALLMKATRLVERANQRLGGLNGQRKRLLEDLVKRLQREEILAFPISSDLAHENKDLVLWIQRYLSRAQNFLRGLRQDGSVRWEEGCFRVFWGKRLVPASAELSALYSRSRSLLSLPEKR